MSGAALLIAVVAFDRGWAIGDGDDLLWELPDDLARFKRATLGRPMIMGRRTHASIGRALPGRRNIVLSRTPSWRPAPGCEKFSSLRAALEACRGAPEVAIIGGAAVYEEALDRLARIELTVVDARYDAPVRFPALAESDWRVTHKEVRPADERHRFARSFVTLERAAASLSSPPAGAEVPSAWTP